MASISQSVAQFNPTQAVYGRHDEVLSRPRCSTEVARLQLMNSSTRCIGRRAGLRLTIFPTESGGANEW